MNDKLLSYGVLLLVLANLAWYLVMQFNIRPKFNAAFFVC